MAVKPILALDFDGTLHSYTSGWQGETVIPDPPVPGAIEALNEYSKHFKIVIFTTRAVTREGQTLIGEWLVDHGFTGEVLDITNVKPPAKVTLDDRAITFTGRWPEVEELLGFKPWTEKPPRQEYLAMLEESLIGYRTERLRLESFLRAEFPSVLSSAPRSAVEDAMFILQAYKAQHGEPGRLAQVVIAMRSLEEQPESQSRAL